MLTAFYLGVKISLFRRYEYLERSCLSLPIANLGARWKRVVSVAVQLHLPREETPVPIEYEAGWALDDLGKK